MATDAASRRMVFLHAAPLVRRLKGGMTEDIPTLDTTTERTLLRETLAVAGKRIGLRCEVATATNLRTVATIGCRALHYTGHGLEHRGLAFEDKKGAMHVMDPQALRNLIAAGGGATDIQFVFVSACYSQSAGEAFVRAGVPHVVACRWDSAVSDHASVIFSRNFYTALLVGRTVKQAFDIGHAAVQAAPGIGGRKVAKVKFMLLPAHADHNVAIFHDAEDGDWYEETPSAIPNSCDAVPRFFIGRNAAAQEVVGFFADKARCVTIRGELGIGKTAVALKACEYMAERRCFPSGIAFVRLRGPGTVLQKLNMMLSMPASTSIEVLSAAIRDERLLLVLDGVGTDPEQRQVQAVFTEILRRTVEPAVLMTAEHAMGTAGMVDAEKVVTIGPLRPLHTAALFTALAPRKLKLDEMGATRNVTALAEFSKHPLIKKLGGHPKTIAKAAQLLQDTTVSGVLARIDKLVSEARTPAYIRRTLSYARTATATPTAAATEERKSDEDLQQVLQGLEGEEISKLLADSFGNRVWRRVGGSKDTVSFPVLLMALENHLSERVACVGSRPLTSENHHYLRQMFMMVNGGVDPLKTKVTIHQFGKLWSWLGPVFQLIARLHQHWVCMTPILIHGFLDKETAARMLRSRESAGAGTFVIRFSARHAGSLAIAFLVADHGPPATPSGPPTTVYVVSHCLVQHVERRGSHKFRLLFEGTGEAYFKSLEELLEHCTLLTHLYPAHPKETVFSRSGGSAASLESFGAPPSTTRAASAAGAGGGAGAGSRRGQGSAFGYPSAGAVPPPTTLARLATGDAMSSFVSADTPPRARSDTTGSVGSAAARGRAASRGDRVNPVAMTEDFARMDVTNPEEEVESPPARAGPGPRRRLP